MDIVIGRTEEIELLRKIEKSSEAELVAVYGRPRVGKTYLIRNGFSRTLDFEFSGSHYAPLKQQLESFSRALGQAMGNVPLAVPQNWIQAFAMLEDYLTPLLKRRRRIIFFDEFPWMNTPRSGFTPAFEDFWNRWGSR